MRTQWSIVRCLIGAAVLSTAACTGDTSEERPAADSAASTEPQGPANGASRTAQGLPMQAPPETGPRQPRGEVTPVTTPAVSAAMPVDSSSDQPPAAGPPQVPPTPGEALAALDRNYRRLLAETVSTEGLVRYGLLGGPQHSAGLEWVVQAFAEIPMPERPAERLAFLCNAYNANVLAKVIERRADPAFTSVGEADGFFDQDQITVAGRTMTLGQLVNEHLRPAGDPRIHAALCSGCATSPGLRNEPYSAAILDAQLDEQCRTWINDPQKNRLSEGRLAVSPIFRRYAPDFEAAPYGGVLGFMAAFADPDNEMTPLLADEFEPPVAFLADDWTLNALVERDVAEK